MMLNLIKQSRKSLLATVTALGIASAGMVVAPQRADAFIIGMGSAINHDRFPTGWFVGGFIFFFICFPIGIILDKDTCSTSSAPDLGKELYAKLPFLKGQEEGRMIEKKIFAQWKDMSLEAQTLSITEKTPLEDVRPLLANHGFDFNAETGAIAIKLDREWLQNTLEDYSQKDIDLALNYLGSF